jgi:hypothetical protein
MSDQIKVSEMDEYARDKKCGILNRKPEIDLLEYFGRGNKWKDNIKVDLK